MPQPPQFGGVFAAAVTPHRLEGHETDIGAMLELVDFLAGSGVQGTVLLGSTGEFLHVKPSDRARIVQFAVKRSRVPIVAGISHSTLDGSLELASEAITSGAAALLLMPPYFFRYDQADIAEFYRRFSVEIGRTTVPMLLYNIPQFTSGLTFETVRDLLDSGRYAGIKDSSGDWPLFQQLAGLRAQRNFTLLVGNDAIYPQAFQAGADGVVSGCACAIPELLVKLHGAMTSGDQARTAMLTGLLNEFIAWTKSAYTRGHQGRDRGARTEDRAARGSPGPRKMPGARRVPKRPSRFPHTQTLTILGRFHVSRRVSYRGHQVVDWLADFLADPGRYPVLSRNRPGELIDALPPSGPEAGEDWASIFQDFERHVVPAVTHWNHPGFMAYFANTASPPGILGEMLAAGLNANGILWKSSPAVTELEQVALSWLRQWMGLSDEWFGIIHDTASTGVMHALAAARQAVAPEVRATGEHAPLAVYCSDQAHSSVEKGALAIGVGQPNVRKIAADSSFRMQADLLERAIEEDLAAGKKPICIVATVGILDASIDPVGDCVKLAQRYGLWLHVDAAYAGSAAIAPEYRWLLDGAEQADSLITNPHK